MRIMIYIGKYEDYALAKLIINRLSSNGVEIVAARDVEVKNLGIPRWDGAQGVDIAW
ncbi:hypothetical protein [Vulcanisaeta distributa]|uniref:hypothetical protein n=1 Tax=Vulcanisaeta distributa TaxID=164451 RepID=UPI000AF08368|nr:hypothetical protein [Vulcanisaeta distributa]